MKITFKQFDRDFREYYDIKDNYTIRTKEDMEEIVYNLYDTNKFEVDYDNKVISLF